MNSDYDKQADDFLARNFLIFTATFKGVGCPKWGEGLPKNQRSASPVACPDCGNVHGHRYRVKISRPRDKGPCLCFDFWDSHANRAERSLRAYSALACLSSDLSCPDTFEEFCAEYGYDGDSRRAAATFLRCSRFARDINAFFTEDEKAELAEIQ